MYATSLQQLAAGVLASVASAAVRSLALASVAGSLLVLFRVKNVSLRLAIWKVVLWSALAMPLLAWLTPPMSFALPRVVISQLTRFIPAGETFAHAASPDARSDAAATRSRKTQWPAHTGSADADSSRGGVDLPSETRIALSAAASPRVNAAANPASGGAAKNRNVSAARIFIALYFAIAVLLLSRLFIGWLLGRRLIRSSHPIRDPRASLTLSLRAFPGHLNEAPLLAESQAVAVPVTLGVMRPVILLPSDWREWESDKLNAVLAHELSHIGRNDALTQRLSKLHRAIYWFSPLAWWLDRELARLAEEASDEAAPRQRRRSRKVCRDAASLLRSDSRGIWTRLVARSFDGGGGRRRQASGSNSFLEGSCNDAIAKNVRGGAGCHRSAAASRGGFDSIYGARAANRSSGARRASRSGASASSDARADCTSCSAASAGALRDPRCARHSYTCAGRSGFIAGSTAAIFLRRAAGFGRARRSAAAAACAGSPRTSGGTDIHAGEIRRFQRLGDG